jgi:alkyldihydroxyacetonephosphate synthase
LSASILEQLSRPLRARASVTLPERLACSRDLWQRRLIEVQHGGAAPPERLPAAVIHPETSAEVEELVGVARREGFSLVPFGAGSGVCGAIECGPRTLVLDTKRMRHVEVTPAGTLRVGPGALGITLERELEARGLTIGHFPSSILCSTVGGWVGGRGAGQCSGRYGKIEDMVLGIDGVLGSGAAVRFPRRRAGLDLVPLLIGSEGTLAVFTELELRLHPTPAERAFIAFELPTTLAGMTLLRRVYQSGLRPAVARLYDPLDSLLLGRHSHAHAASTSLEPWDAERHRNLARWLAWPALTAFGIAAAERTFMRKTKLVFVFEGEPGEAHADARAALALAEDEGGHSLGEAPARRWFERRYAVSYDQSLVFRHGSFSDTLEVASPWSTLDALYEGVRRAVGRYALVMAHLSHAYPDGCSIYFTFVAPSRPGQAQQTHQAIWRDAMAAALEAGGTISHHHGVGRLRADALAEELGAGGMELLSRVKAAWDPAGILCPGSPIGAKPARPPSASSAADATSDWRVDPISGLARAPAAMPVAHVERALRAEGRTLALEGAPPVQSVGDWVAAGLPGMPDALADPVDQRLAGFGAHSAELRIEVRPAPRRAAGPDLSALWLGAGGRIGEVEHVWLRARSERSGPARALPFVVDRTPATTPAESSAWEALVRAVNPQRA